MRTRMLCAPALVVLIGCRAPPETAPSQVDAARIAASIASATREQAHWIRLRDIERLRYEAELTELRSIASALGGLVTLMGVCLVAAVIWLAIEIRRRRILTTILASFRTPAESTVIGNDSSDL